VEKDNCRFTGYDTEKCEDIKTVSMKNYARSMEEIAEIRKEDRHDQLKRSDKKEYIKFMGKLS